MIPGASMETNKPSILCVDDNEDNLELLEIIFREKNFEVKSCNSIDNCLPLIYEGNFTAIILDNWFANKTSIEVCQQIRRFDPTIPIIYYSAEVRETEIVKALQAGATAYLTKPCDFVNLTETVNRYIQLTRFKV